MGIALEAALSVSGTGMDLGVTLETMMMVSGMDIGMLQEVSSVTSGMSSGVRGQLTDSARAVGKYSPGCKTWKCGYGCLWMPHWAPSRDSYHSGKVKVNVCFL